MRLDVIDLSHWNKTPDFVQLKAGGLVGVILKATEGTTVTDKAFKTRRKMAQDAGLVVSSYHFLRPGSVAAQMRHYLDCVQPVPGERVVVDYEHEKCQIKDLRTAVAELDADQRQLQITVYGGHLLKQQLAKDPDPRYLGAYTSLWVAQYNSTGPVWPKGTWPSYSLWQYSDGKSGGHPRHMAGMAGETDCNEFNGSRDNCAIWLAPAKPAKPAEPELPVINLETLYEVVADHEIRLRKLEGKN